MGLNCWNKWTLFSLSDSHKHKDKYKEKEHKHKDHKKDKEREKSKHGNGYAVCWFVFYRCTFLHVGVWFADKTDHSVSAPPPTLFEDLKQKAPEFNWAAFYKTSQGLLWQKTQRQGEGKDEAQRWQHRQIQGQAQGEKEGGEGEPKTNLVLNIFFQGLGIVSSFYNYSSLLYSLDFGNKLIHSFLFVWSFF